MPNFVSAADLKAANPTGLTAPGDEVSTFKSPTELLPPPPTSPRLDSGTVQDIEAEIARAVKAGHKWLVWRWNYRSPMPAGTYLAIVEALVEVGWVAALVSDGGGVRVILEEKHHPPRQ